MQCTDAHAGTYCICRQWRQSSQPCIVLLRQPSGLLCQMSSPPPPSLSAFCRCFIDLSGFFFQNQIQYSKYLSGFLLVFRKPYAHKLNPPIHHTKKRKEVNVLNIDLPSVVQLVFFHLCSLFTASLVTHCMWMRLIKIQCSSLIIAYGTFCWCRKWDMTSLLCLFLSCVWTE